jgi:hypothetical protein
MKQVSPLRATLREAALRASTAVTHGGPEFPASIFKLAVHERWYTTKHENLTPTTPLHPYTPTLALSR